MLELQVIDESSEPSRGCLVGVDPQFSQDVVDRALELIRKGNRVVTACRAAGISDDIYARWTAERPDFRLAVQTAEGLAEASIVEIIVQLIKGATAVTTKITTTPDGTKKEETRVIKSDFAAIRYFLEHRFPDGWKLSGSSTVSAPDDSSDDDEIVVTYVKNHPGALSLDPD